MTMNITAVSKHVTIGLATTIVMAASARFTATGQDNTGVTVCVGPDSVLRAPASGVCPPGSRQTNLAGALVSADVVDASDALGPTKKREATLDWRLQKLEERVASLQNGALFEVVNEKGDVIFRVTPDRVQLYGENKSKAAEIIATPDGGEFVAHSRDGKLSTFFGAYGDRAGLRITEGGYARLDLLKQVSGNYSLRIHAGVGDIAGIGESQAGTGVLAVGDIAGNHRATLEVDGGKGSVNVFNKAGQGVASLTQSENGGGLLVLANAAGSATVLMKTNDNRYGVVMALPAGLPYVPKSGLPGSYMLGCAGGPACVR